MPADQALPARTVLSEFFHDDEPCDCMKSPHDALLECQAWADNVLTALSAAGFAVVRRQGLCFCGDPDDRQRVHRSNACEPWQQKASSDV